MIDGALREWSTEYWLRQWRSGDGSAVAQLYDRYRRLLRLAVVNGPYWSLLKSEHADPDEIVHGLWARVMDGGASRFTYRGKDSFAAWLLSALSRFEIDQVRRAGRRKRGGWKVRSLDQEAVNAVERALPIATSRGDPTPSSTARYHDGLRQAKRVLRDDEYLAWRMIKLQGLTSPEAGLVLRRSGAAARALVDRAVEKLLTAFGQSSSD